MIVTHYNYSAESMLDEKPFEEGAIYFIEDTKRIYMDPIGGSNRILISGDPIVLNTEADREDILAPTPGKIYIVIETGKTYIYQDGSWYGTGASITIKAGIIYINPSNTLPDGFLWCDGAAYSRTEYPELFAAIGTKYGAGDGSTTFNVPDLTERVPVGAGDGYELGETSEAEQNDTVVIINTGSVTNGTNSDKHMYTVVNYMISTGKGSSADIAAIIEGVQVLPLGEQYGGTGCTSIEDFKEKLGIEEMLANASTTRVYSQTEEPTDAKAGDLWIDPDDDGSGEYDGYQRLSEEVANLESTVNGFSGQMSTYMPLAGGTFTGNAMAGTNYQAASTSLLRNSKLVAIEETPTVEGEIYWMYE